MHRKYRVQIFKKNALWDSHTLLLMSRVEIGWDNSLFFTIPVSHTYFHLMILYSIAYNELPPETAVGVFKFLNLFTSPQPLNKKIFCPPCQLFCSGIALKAHYASALSEANHRHMLVHSLINGYINWVSRSGSGI